MRSSQSAGIVTLRRLSRIGLGLLLLGSLAWIAYSGAGINARTFVLGLTLAFSAFLAALTAVYVAVYSAPVSMRFSWALFALGILLMGSNGLRLMLQVLGYAFDSNLADPLRLGALVALGLGLLFYPRQRRPGVLPALLFLDIMVVFGSALLIVWTLILSPLLRTLTGNALLLLLYPIVGLALLLLLLGLFQSNDSASSPPALAWVALSLAFFACAALLQAFLFQRSSVAALSVVDVGWVLGSYLLTMGGFSYPAIYWRKSRLPVGLARIIARLQPLLPHILILLLGFEILSTWLLYRQLYPSGLLAMVMFSLVMVARQAFAVGESEIRPYASLVNSIADPAFVCDENGLLRLANPALLSATGYPSAGDLLNRPLAHILDSQADTSYMLDLALARNAGPNDTRPIGWSGETRLLRRDGKLIPVYLSLRPIQPDNTLPETARARVALAGTAYDLTRQKKQQADIQTAYQQVASAHEQLEHLNAELEQKVAEETQHLNQAYRQLEAQNQKLQMLDQLKSDFVSLVSHELRAPLTNINGGIELVLSRPGPLAPGVRSNLELVQAEIQRLTRFVETILDLSALDAGRLPLYLAPIPYASVVQTLQNQLMHLPGTERIRWEAPSLPNLLADERAITSVLFHLVDNALKYAPQGEIIVSAQEEAGGLIAIRVLDCGSGIQPEALPLLFDRFYRANTQDSQTVYGHGLGLYIVRRLTEAMGGWVEVSNRPEGGACFTCCLKAAGEIEVSDEL